MSSSFANRVENRNALITDNLHVVNLVMRQLLPRLPGCVDADDLRSAGIMGLVDAAEKYDPSRAVRFSTYAEIRVRGAMLDYLRSLSWAPRALHRSARQVRSARASIEQRACRQATASELAEQMGLSLEECQRVLLWISGAELLDYERALSVSKEGGDPAAELERKEKLQIIWRAVELLPERQRQVLWLYYVEELSMKEVGAVLGVNESRASQLHSKAIAALRHQVGQLISVGEQ
jgi:RNA polymerase sigma factor for flagellar operon FliA